MWNRTLISSAAALVLTSSAALAAAPAYEAPRHDLPPAVQQHVDMTYLLANGAFAPDVWTQYLSGIVLPPGATPPLRMTDKKVTPPVKEFDQLVYLGMSSVGSWALKTSAGIILFDTLDNEQEARDIIEAGLRKVGWDPAQIKYIVITHGHGDHYGGAKYLQDKYHPRLLAGPADWALMTAPPPPRPPGDQRPAPQRPPAPRHDMDVVDGQKLTLGDTTVTLYLTPGHTPATVSVIIPASEHGRRHMLSFWGGTGAPQTLGPTPTNGGLLAYEASLKRFTKLGVDAGVDGIISNHPINDDTHAKVLALKPNQPNPWVTGRDGYLLYMGAFVEATEALIAAQDGERGQAAPPTR